MTSMHPTCAPTAVQHTRLFDLETGCFVPLLDTRDLRVSIFYPGLTSFLIGLFKVFAMIFFLLNNVRNRWILSKIDRIACGSEYNAASRSIILPTYYPLVYVLIFTDLMFGITDITLFWYVDHKMHPSKAFFWIFPFQLAIYHAISEGIAIFYTKSGAGLRSMLEATKFACCWFIFNLVFMFIAVSLPSGYIVSSPIDLVTASFALLFIYNVVILVFYVYLAYSPNMRLLYKIFGDSNSLNRRPALILYAKFNIYYNLYWIVFGTIVFCIGENRKSVATCVAHYIGVALVGVGQAYNIWSSLVTDSQYWQGYFDTNNPLKEAIDLVSLNTAASISENLSLYETDKRELPLLHFGLISLNDSMKFVAGGVSRVYFGKFKEKNLERDVAIKLMYLMEFNPTDVRDFFEEAVTLHTLKNPRIVECYGICVMPPAITMVLEFCKYGSLFDFLHKGGVQRHSEAPDSAPRSFSNITGQRRNSKFIDIDGNSNENPMLASSNRKTLTKFDIESDLAHKNSGAYEGSTSRTNSRASIGSNRNSNGMSKFDSSCLHVMAVDAAEAIEHLHSKGFMHCDMKSLNFLVAEGFRLKLADMGEARHCDSTPKRAKPPVAALNWAPPEVLQEGSDALAYTKSSDIFGLAIIINEILACEIPYGTKCNSATHQGWYFTLVKENLRPTFPPNMHAQVKEILERAWHSDPSLRCSGSEIKEVLISTSVSDVRPA